jgi:type II secretory pathway pseudopilin PulG
MKPRSTDRRFVLRTGFLLLVVLGLLLMVVIPTINGALATARYNEIIQTLRVIENQKQLWASVNKKSDNDTPRASDLVPYFQNGLFPPSTIGETYNINPVGKPPTATVPTRLRTPKGIIEAGGKIDIPNK